MVNIKITRKEDKPMNIKNKRGMGSAAGLIFVLTLGLAGAGAQGAIAFTKGAGLVPAVFTSVSYSSVVGTVLGADKFQKKRYSEIYGTEPTGLSREEILVAIADSVDNSHEAVAFYASEKDNKRGGKLRAKLLAMQK